MSRPTNLERHAAVHARALNRFLKLYNSVLDERQMALSDRRFYSIAGAQWEGSWGEQFKNRPKFEVNKIDLAVTRIINEFRSNRSSVEFLPKSDDEATIEFAQVCNDLYRGTERDGCGEEAIDNAFEEAVGGGFGAWLVRADYEDEEEDLEEQLIEFEPIFDADQTVFFDPSSKHQDKSDARWAWRLIPVSLDDFEDEYGDDPTSWPTIPTEVSQFDWVTPDSVYVAKYYEVERYRIKMSVFRYLDGHTEEVAEDELTDDKQAELDAVGAQLLRVKKINKKRIHLYLLSGGGVIEDEGYIAGCNIPIIPVFGKRWVVNGVERFRGVVRPAKDAQRLKNMQLSKLGELTTHSPVEKPIFTAEQIVGRMEMWERDNVENYPYLLINPVTDPQTGLPQHMGPVGYTKPPAIPEALALLLQTTEQDMEALLGNQQSAEEVQANVSAKAIELVQARLDMQAFIYISNARKAHYRAGQVWLSMAKDLYTKERRQLSGLNQDGESVFHTIMRPVVNKTTETSQYENDFTKANFGMRVEIGPANSSRRQALVRNLLSVMAIANDPETNQVLAAMIMMNLEGEGVQEVRKYYREKLIGMGVVEPTRAEVIEFQQKHGGDKPDPQSQYLTAAAGQANAEAAKARMDTILNSAKATKLHADTIKTMSEVNTAEREQLERELTNQSMAPTEPPAIQ